MANSTISGLPVATAPTGQELFPVVQNGVTKQLSLLYISQAGVPTTSVLVGHLAEGTGAEPTSVAVKLRQIISTPDYGTVDEAVAVAEESGTGTLTVPNGVSVSLPGSFLGTVFDFKSETDWAVYNETDPGRRVRRLLHSQSPGSHPGVQRTLFGRKFQPEGSGINGPGSADIADGLSIIKLDWLTTLVPGEIDGQNIVVRQGGPAAAGTAASDAAGTLWDVAIKDGVGFACLAEGGCAIVNNLGVTQRGVRAQLGVMDSVTSTYIGLVSIAETGVIDDGLRILSAASASYTNFIRCFTPGGREAFKVDSNGQIVLRDDSGSTPSKTLRNNSGLFTILNDAQDAQILTLTDTGGLQVLAGIAAGSTIQAPGFAGLVSGMHLATTVAGQDDAILVDSSGSGTWDYYLRFKNLAGVDLLAVDTNGKMRLQAPSGATPGKSLRVDSGVFAILNDAESAQILTLSDVGGLSLLAGVTAGGNISGTTLTASAPTAAGAAGAIVLGNSTATTAGNGGGEAVKANVEKYWVVNISGTNYKVPLFKES